MGAKQSTHFSQAEQKRRYFTKIKYWLLSFIDKHSLLSLYHSYIHFYINYENIAWGSTTRINLKKIYSQQKHAIRIVYSKDRFSHTREVFKECKVLNIYQVNIWKNLVFMHQIDSNTVPSIFLNSLKKPNHNYLTNFARTNYSIPHFKLNKSKFRTSIRGATLRKKLQPIQKKSNRRPMFLKP